MPSAFSIYYTEEEKKLFEEICKKKGIPFSAIENLVEEETDFRGMGRRKWLFPTIKKIIKIKKKERKNLFLL